MWVNVTPEIFQEIQVVFLGAYMMDSVGQDAARKRVTDMLRESRDMYGGDFNPLFSRTIETQLRVIHPKT